MTGILKAINGTDIHMIRGKI